MEKRIIYCWFPCGKDKPETVQNCIKTWKDKMPEWEYLEINESNFDINYNEYVKEAYKNSFLMLIERREYVMKIYFFYQI